jgi:DNA damage-binding protein 1
MDPPFDLALRRAPIAVWARVLRLETAVVTQVVKGVGGLSHAEWRSFSNEHRNTDGTHNNFIDGDLIESFLDLKKESMDDVAKIMEMPVEELCKKVEELTRLH